MRINIVLLGWDRTEKGEREKLISLFVLTVIATIAWLLIAAAPSLPFGNNYGSSPAEKKMAQRLRDIARSSHGDWKLVSGEDRRFLIFDVSYGDEGSARMLLNAVSRHMKGKQHSGKPIYNRPSK